MEESKTFLDYLITLSPVVISIFALVLSYLANLKLSKQKDKELQKDYKLKETDLLEKIKEYERKEIYKKLLKEKLRMMLNVLPNLSSQMILMKF